MSCVLDSNDIRGVGYFDELYAIESSVYEFCHLSQQGSNRLYQSPEKRSSSARKFTWLLCTVYP